MKKNKFKLYELGLNYPWVVVISLIVITLVSIYTATFLRINSDPLTLLPQKTQSVRNLAELKKYFGSNMFLMVSVESSNDKLSENFSADFIEKIKYFPEIIYVDNKRPVSFFKDRQWLFLRMKDLLEIEKRVDRTLDLEKKGVSLVFNDYVDFADEDTKPDLTFKDILDKYINNPWVPKSSSISSDEGRFKVIRLKISDDLLSFSNTQSFLDKLKKVEKDLKSNFVYKDVVVGYSGTLISRIDQSKSIQKEIVIVSIVVSALLFLAIYIYFKNLESIFLIGIPLGISVVVTGGLTYIFFSHLNLITSFGAGIIAGLGSDYGIYLLNRYYYERNEGRSFEEAAHITFSNTGAATYGSMLTMLSIFIALLFSDFRFFYEFGVVGALGIYLNYLCMILFIPASLKILDKWRKKHSLVKIKPEGSYNGLSKRFFYHKWASPFFIKAPILGLVLTLALASVSFVVLPEQIKVQYTESLVENKTLPSKMLLKRVGKAMKTSLNPTVLIAKSAEAERRATELLTNLLFDKKRTDLVYGNVVGLSSFISPDIKEKKEVINRISQKMLQVKYLPEEQKNKYVISFQKALDADEPTKQNIPIFLKRFFESPFNPEVYAIYLYPSISKGSNEGLKRYHDGILKIIQQYNLDVIPVDMSFSADDIIRLITREAPQGLALVFLFLFLVCYFISRSLVRTGLILFCLLISLIFLSATLWLVGIELNIINIVAMLIILGAGIDSFIHFAQHYDEHKDMRRTLAEKIPVIFVSNITSIIGFAGLILTSLYGLQSLGWVVTLGLTIITLVCAFVFPRGLLLEEKFKRKTPNL